MVKPVIGITMGDPAGIGPEVCAKAMVSSGVRMVANPVIIGDRKVLREALKTAKIESVEINSIKRVQEAKFARDAIDVIDLDNVKLSSLKIGQVSKIAGKAAVEYLEKAIQLAKNKEIEAITTAPISKEAIHLAGYKFQGHTEILAKRFRVKNYGMLFVSDRFWLMLVTTHIPLRDVSRRLNKKKILNTILLAHETLSKVRGKKIKIGVAGLNPHAGEAGIFGKEEGKIIKPAVDAALKLGVNVKGPISPDAIFHLANSGMFDLVVAMYHDQGLIPLKLLSFNRSVNVTVGLPVVRTSVDHGTGFDIAGKGWANPGSLIEAVRVAAHLARLK
ncbi:4-hydroxythreonine-4-phosphate dehydrogenase PdxA [Candidatus Saganbacteria bacterium]|uniref:4-hydroxythreonine-4-phosphate dehydrogenase PdxA n=1 Tax=Candidatus Saganbacteria bacterium TaxID=2575572 RepID=A0A9D6UKH3_UNCSA|nr:4-hydroxythreonine-4-phosphate dehydrogenase PdxA [Candidatus Saganbacteria bacterium]